MAMSILNGFLHPKRRQVSPSARVETISGPTMGTRYAVKLVVHGDSDLLALREDVQATVDAVDAQMSTWKPHSDLNRFNAQDPGKWVSVPADLAHVVALGLDISAMTNGAFDMSVGNLVNSWGFGPNGQPSVVPADAATPHVTFRDIAAKLSPPALRKLAPAYLDLSGIAKGFGVDAVAETLTRYGVSNFVVDIDGEVRACGSKPDGSGWSVGLEHPEKDAGTIIHILSLGTIAIATSGDYRRFFEAANTRYSHTIDPLTGRPTTSAIASVTVADLSCARADALATALLVMGPEEGPSFANRNRLSALFLIRSNDRIIERTTYKFDQFVSF